MALYINKREFRIKWHIHKIKIKDKRGRQGKTSIVKKKKQIKNSNRQAGSFPSRHTISLHQGVLLPVGVGSPDEECRRHELQGG